MNARREDCQQRGVEQPQTLPADGVEEPGRDHHHQREAERQERAPQAERQTEIARIGRFDDQRRCGDDNAEIADTLDHAGQEQQRVVVGQRAEQAAGGDRPQADDQHPSVAETVAQGAERQPQDRAGGVEDRCDPAQRHHTHRELGCEHRHCRRHLADLGGGDHPRQDRQQRDVPTGSADGVRWVVCVHYVPLSNVRRTPCPRRTGRSTASAIPSCPSRPIGSRRGREPVVR